jgi:putative tryptophan/tyrosine transport system substrate-binding protein
MRRREFIGLIGGVAAWPFAVRAQQNSVPVVGFLHFSKPGLPLQDEFLQGLKDTGYFVGQNFAIEYRWAEGQYDRSQAMAADLVGRKVDVIAAFGPPLARAAKDATSTIPIVFEVGNDAVEAELVTGLARPGGNATGLSVLFIQMTPKLLELISEIVPQVRIVGLLVNPNSPTAEPTIRDAQEAARAKGVQLAIVKAGTVSEIDAAFAALTDLRADALIVGADPFLGNQGQQLITQAAWRKIPAIYFSGGFTASGGLISYGADLAAVYRRMSVYVGKILRGEKPANLPVEQPTKFNLSINLKTAKALGLNMPPSLLGRADQVIE